MERDSARAGFGGAIVIAIVVFAAVAPTLAWLEFSGGSENLNAATVLEMRRGGPWLVPTLNGRARLAKPNPMPKTAYCPFLYNWGKQHDKLVTAPESGDVFLVKGGPNGHKHTGLVTEAASRAERLADRLAAGNGKRGS